MKIFTLCFVLIFSSQSYAHADLMNGLVGWWKFDEGSGNAAVDSSGQGNTGILQNSPTWTAGIRNSALNLDGNNQYVTTTFTPPNQFSFSAWFYAAGSIDDYNRGVASTFAGGTYNGFYLSTGSVTAHGCTAGANKMMLWYDGNNCLNPNFSFSNNVWYHTVITSDGINMRVYVNGQLTNTQATTTAHADVLHIGQSKFDTNYWKGLIDDVRIYNRALTATEVNDLYQQGQGRVSYGINSVIGNSKTSY